MFGKIEILQVAQGLATHAARRQSLIAQNVANADTPGYRARDLEPFSQLYARSGLGAVLGGGQGGSEPRGLRAIEAARPGALSPNGNSVALESEMMAAAEARRDHDLALTVYRTSLDIMRASLGRG